MSDIADRLGKAEILGDWKLAENLSSRMSMVTAAEVKAVVNRYAKYITWVYIGNPDLGNKSFKD
jgi:predicted Zn-dependent peptidase